MSIWLNAAGPSNSRRADSSGSSSGKSQASTAAAPATFHTADLNRDGRLSLDELTRVIELYNARPAGTRTGAYHSDAATVDSFAPGP